MRAGGYLFCTSRARLPVEPLRPGAKALATPHEPARLAADGSRPRRTCRVLRRPGKIADCASAADAGVSAVGAEVAAVFADQCLVAALGAFLPGQRPEPSAVCLLGRRYGEDSGMLDWVALLGEDAEHRVAVDHQLGEIGDRRRVRLRLVRSRDARDE